MANNLDPVRKKEILESLVNLCADHSLSEAARKLNISASSVRWHGVLQMGLKFKRERWSTKKIMPAEGITFENRAGDNWLI